ncbi:hypothetical protein JTB14_001477 [Gonioctena quinquepunctata]|nr:hypothetical protein JTB14_001477 [Gonioctena quinquepunctata]
MTMMNNMYNRLTVSVSENARMKILDKLENDCFVRMGNSLGCTKVVEHKIELLDNGEPIKQRFHPVLPALMKHIDGELQDMLKKDVIEPFPSFGVVPL